MSLAAEGVSMEMNPVNLETEAKATISHVSDAPPLDAEEELPMAVYDFKLEGADTFPGVAQLVIPLELGAGELPGAAWYNEETKAWEPVSFRYDSARKAAVIATDHFSKYGVFTVSKAGMRKARLEFLGLADDSGGSEEFLEAINEYTVGGVPAGVCRDIGIGAAGDAMQLGSDVLGNLVQGPDLRPMAMMCFPPWAIPSGASASSCLWSRWATAFTTARSTMPWWAA